MLPALQCTLILMTSLIVAGQDWPSRHGRQLCSRWSHHRQAVPVRQSYRRPVYREGSNSVTYQTAYRTVFRMQQRAAKVEDCCPGWERREPSDKLCLQPICKKKCIHGKCVAPEVCMCNKGFTGHKCHIELDECSGRNACQQKCVNTFGSYTCECFDGFSLNDDKKTCRLCLSCLDEFKEMEQSMLILSERIDILQEEKSDLQANLTSVIAQYKKTLTSNSEVSEFKLSQTTPSSSRHNTTSQMAPQSDAGTIPLDRLTSLSEQISILEERMATCSCGNDDDMYYG